MSLFISAPESEILTDPIAALQRLILRAIAIDESVQQRIQIMIEEVSRRMRPGDRPPIALLARAGDGSSIRIGIYRTDHTHQPTTRILDAELSIGSNTLVIT